MSARPKTDPEDPSSLERPTGEAPTLGGATGAPPDVPLLADHLRAVRALEPVVALMERYFDAEVRGLDRLPPGPALLVGNHNGNVMTPDTWLFARAFYRHTGYSERLVGLGHDVIFRIPGVAAVARAAGVVSASPDAAVANLHRGHKVLVYPGGAWEAGRPSRERDRIDFHGRRGFLRIAMLAKVPIVPIVAAGSHDGWLVLTRGERLARWLRLKQWLRVDTFPIALGLPTGLVMGPFTPYLPLPSRIVVQVLDPIRVEGDPDDETACSALYEQVLGTMQAELSRLAAALRKPRRTVQEA